MDKHRPARRHRQGRPHRRVQADPPGQLLRRHADPAGLLAGTRRSATPTCRAAPSSRNTRLRRPLQDRLVRADEEHHLHPQPRLDAATDPIRKAYVDKIVINETVSQDSIQQQLQTGTPSADMEWDVFPPPSQLPALIAKKDPNLNLGETSSSQPVRRVQHGLAEQQQGAGQRQGPAGAVLRDQPRRNIIQVLGGPTLNHAAHATSCRPASSVVSRTSTSTPTTRQGQADCSPQRATRTG